MDSSACLQSLKSAIALSNMGTKLLERRKPCSAVCVIKDALFFIRACLSENSKYLASDELDRLTSEAILKASKAVAQSYINEPLSMPDDCSSTNPRQRALFVHIVSDTESPMTAIIASSQGIATSYQKNEVPSPIIAFHMADRCPTEEYLDSMDFEAATVLFNLASALRCVPVTDLPNGEQELSRKHLCESFRVLHLAYSILRRRSADVNACWIDEGQTTRLFALSTMVVQSLLALCPVIGVSLVDQEFLVQQLQQIYRAYAHLLEQSPWWQIKQHDSAPAA